MGSSRRQMSPQQQQWLVICCLSSSQGQLQQLGWVAGSAAEGRPPSSTCSLVCLSCGSSPQALRCAALALGCAVVGL